MEKPAIEGGRPAVSFEQPHFSWPPITDQTRSVVLDQLEKSISIYNRSGIIEELEDRLANYHGVSFALLTNSGTAALHSLYVGADLRPGDEVLCPAYTFFATATPILFTGAKPIFVDCDRHGNMDPEDARSKVTDKTRAVVLTHMWGMPCDMAGLRKVAQDNDLLLLEDGSHAHGARYEGQVVGSFGDGAAFSLQGQKTLTGGEGGFLLTDNEEIYYRALALGHYNKRCRQEIPPTHPLAEFAVTGMGLKMRIHPVAAAIANQQLDELDEVLSGRRETAQMMIKALSEVPGIETPAVPSQVEHSWYAFLMQYRSEELGGLPIERFVEALEYEGCAEVDRPGSTCPLQHHALFQNPDALFPRQQSTLPAQCPKSEIFHERAIKLPVWHDEEDQEIARQYVDAIRKVGNWYRRAS
jgi:dTDP-4-amino-4,6-dideoxygalactose transaminase